MNKGGLVRVVLGLVGLILSISLFVTVLTGMGNLIDTAVTKGDVEEEVVTADVTAANVTLPYSLLNDDIANVISISSNETETPAADSYANLILTVGSLSANTTRTLTTSYSHGILGYFTALETIIVLAPVVLFLGMIFGSGYLVASGAMKIKKKGGEID